LFVRGPGFDDGTPLPIEESRAENPPDGAVIDYFLGKPAKLVQITISDSSGKVLGKFASDDKLSPPDLTKLTIAPYWVRPPQVVSAKAGAHRFVWGVGPAKPGDYVVTLTVDGKPFTQPLKIVPDPRATASGT